MRAGSQSRGFTLFELLVAVLLFAMISAMIASVLSAGIHFEGQGEKRILALERENGLLKLLHSQVRCAHFDTRQQKVLISADDSILRVVTREHLLYPGAGPVLAVYRYNEADGGLYYTEKRDYFNVEYNDEYVPDFADMRLLLHLDEPPGFAYDEEAGTVTVHYAGRDYQFSPRCRKVPEQF